MISRILLRPFYTLLILLLTAQTVIGAEVTLAWDPNDPAPDGYNLYQRIAGGSYDYNSPVNDQSIPHTEVDCSGSPCIQYQVTDLPDGVTYYFVVRAFVGPDQSGDSNEVEFIAAVIPPWAISASSFGDGTIDPEGVVNISQGGGQTFNITPDPTGSIIDVLVDGVSVGPVTSYTFTNVQGNHQIHVVFEQLTDMMTPYVGSGIITWKYIIETITQPTAQESIWLPGVGDLITGPMPQGVIRIGY